MQFGALSLEDSNSAARTRNLTGTFTVLQCYKCTQKSVREERFKEEDTDKMKRIHTKKTKKSAYKGRNPVRPQCTRTQVWSSHRAQPIKMLWPGVRG